MPLRYVLIVAVGLALWAAVPAAAQSSGEGAITVIQPKPVLRANRVHLMPRFGTTVNNPLLRQFMVGGSLGFNITERWSVSGTFEWFDFGRTIGGTTERYERTIFNTDSVPELAPLTWYAGLDVSFVPLFGKIVMFNRVIAFWDVSLTLGGGVVESLTSPHPAGTGAVSFNLYMTKWLALTGDVRTRMSVEELPSGNSMVSTITTSLGMTIFMPFNFRYDALEVGQ